jgi:hypothetical protein
MKTTDMVRLIQALMNRGLPFQEARRRVLARAPELDGGTVDQLADEVLRQGTGNGAFLAALRRRLEAERAERPHTTARERLEPQNEGARRLNARGEGARRLGGDV